MVKPLIQSSKNWLQPRQKRNPPHRIGGQLRRIVYPLSVKPVTHQAQSTRNLIEEIRTQTLDAQSNSAALAVSNLEKMIALVTRKNGSAANAD